MKWTLVVTMLAGCLGAPPARDADRERDTTFDDLLDTLEAVPRQAGQLLERTGLRPRTLYRLSAAASRTLGDQDAVPKLVVAGTERAIAMHAAMVGACDRMRENARRAITRAIQMRADEAGQLIHIDIAATAATMLDHALYSPGAAAQKQVRDYFIRVAWQRRARL